jgi:hypothetical protein
MIDLTCISIVGIHAIRCRRSVEDISKWLVVDEDISKWLVVDDDDDPFSGRCKNKVLYKGFCTADRQATARCLLKCQKANVTTTMSRKPKSRFLFDAESARAPSSIYAESLSLQVRIAS